MLTADYHTHTRYSDGKSDMEDNVQQAVARGLGCVAITEHGWGHAFYGMKRERMDAFRADIERLRVKYPQIRLLMGIEANILGVDGKTELRDEDYDCFDIVLAGYHFGSRPRNLADLGFHLVNYLHRLFGLFPKRARRMNTRALINAMRKNRLHILTHPGDKGPVDIVPIAAVAKQTHTMLEINERHHYLTVEQLQEIGAMDVKLVVSSDAHQAQAVGVVDGALARLQAADVDLKNVVNLRRKS